MNVARLTVATELTIDHDGFKSHHQFLSNTKATLKQPLIMGWIMGFRGWKSPESHLLESNEKLIFSKPNPDFFSI